MILFARFLRVGAEKIQNTAAHKLRCFFVVGCHCGANLHARQNVVSGGQMLKRDRMPREKHI